MVLSIDPWEPFEVLIGAISKLIKHKQKQILRLLRQQCKKCREGQFEGLYEFQECLRLRNRLATEDEEEFLDEIVKQERLHSDLHRSREGKKTRNQKTTFENWWLYLRVYHARKNERATWQEVVSAPWYSKNPPPNQEKSYISNDIRKAQALIDAAWNNKPLAAVKLPN